MDWTKLGWLAVGIVANAFAAIAGAWLYFGVAMSGFNTSQQTLATSMTQLHESLDEEKQYRQDKLDQAKSDLGIEIKNLAAVIRQLDQRLSERLEDNSTQVATLNSTLVALDTRLTESIRSQQAFQDTVIQRMLIQGPAAFTAKIDTIDMWTKVGADSETIRKAVDQADAGLLGLVNESLVNPPKP